MVTPPIAWRAGIDADPVDLTVPENARWLLACVFPDTGRLEHTRAAIAEARADPPRVERGDAIEVLPSLLREVPDGLLACLVTTQAFAYFAVERRSEFVDLLDDESRRRPLSWVSIEAPGVVEALGAVEVPADGNASPSVVGLVRFESGAHAAEVLGLAQSHGAWLDWRAA
jgi:hypothetical protein